MPTQNELLAEVRRLQEQLRVLEAREVSPSDMGIAGRIALTRLRDTDFPELVKAVEAIPTVYETNGYWAALAYCQTHVRSCLDALGVSDVRTPDLVQTQHRVHQMLDEGQADIMMRRDQAGLRSRMDFLHMAERYFYGPSIRAAFAKGAETPAGLMPSSFGRQE